MSLVEELVSKAQHLEASGKDDEAITCWQEALAIERRPLILARLGRLRTREGEFQEGERLLREAISIEPTYAEAYFYLGFNQKARNQLDSARDALEYALQLEEWGPGLVALGEVYRQLNLESQALQCFKRAAEFDPDDSEAWYGVGLMLRFVDRGKAIDSFRRAVASDPTNAPAHREFGHMLWRGGQLDSAEESIRTALRLNDTDPWAHHYLGHILLRTDREREAEAEFRKAVALWPDLPLFYCNLGDALARQNRMSEAEENYKHALSMDTRNALANLRMGQLYKERGQFARARMYLERALNSDPSDRRAKEALAALDHPLDGKDQ